MPNKVNPIDFENAENNLKMAVGLTEVFGRELPVSRLQRHLSDSTMIRNFGVCFGHILVALHGIKRGLCKIAPNPEKLKEALDAHPEVISEAIQTVFRRYGVSDAYDQLKNKTRGRKVTLEDLREVINSAAIPPDAKKRLLELTPRTYIGLAPELARLM